VFFLVTDTLGIVEFVANHSNDDPVTIFLSGRPFRKLLSAD